MLLAQTHSPKEVATKGTKGRLAEEFGHKFMTFHLVDFVMFDGTTTSCYAATAQAKIVPIQHVTYLQHSNCVHH